MSWSREQVICLLTEYKKHPCLYVVKTKNYKNKRARANALEMIRTELKCLKPNVTVVEIKTKYSALRSNFLVEHRKHEASKKSGAKEIYRPSIWYYDLMTFILEHWIPKTSIYDSVNIDLDKQQNDYEQYEYLDESLTEEKELQSISHSQNISDDYLPEEETIPNYVSTMIFDEDVQNSTPSISFENTVIQNENKKGHKKRKISDKEASTLQGTSAMSEQKKSTNEDDIDTFLKFLRIRLKRIKNIVIYENTEMNILNVVNEALQLDRST